MRLILDLDPTASIALRRFAVEIQGSPKEAAVAIIHDYLIQAGMVAPDHELEEDTETKGSA